MPTSEHVCPPFPHLIIPLIPLLHTRQSPHGSSFHSRERSLAARAGVPHRDALGNLDPACGAAVFEPGGALVAAEFVEVVDYFAHFEFVGLC